MEALRQHYNRFPTQEAERIDRPPKNEQTSIIYNSDADERGTQTD